MVISEEWDKVGGGTDLSNYEYKTFTWSASQGVTIPTNGKAKALVARWSSHIGYCADGVANNHMITDGVEDSSISFQFNDNSITSQNQFSSASISLAAYIIY